jgi:hypothetical protein
MKEKQDTGIEEHTSAYSLDSSSLKLPPGVDAAYLAANESFPFFPQG